MLTSERYLDVLANAPFGAYAVTADQTIVFWNRGAERILGHRAEDVVGLRCYEAVASLAQEGVTPVCMEGCPSLLAFRAGHLPHEFEVRMRIATGGRRLVSLTPMVVGGASGDQALLLHLFDVTTPGPASDDAHRRLAEQGARVTAQAVTAAPRGAQLTRRELQVLQLVAQGRGTQEIADDLGISLHTVRNHVRHFRRKLDARTKLEAVVTAIRLGVLDGI